MDQNIGNENKYVHTEDVHNLTAPRAVVPFLLSSLQIKSVFDLGCGIGTWLRVFEEQGIVDFVGVDGDYVDPSLLKISKEKFLAHDLRQPLRLKRKFDLAICLEVAEHLPESSAMVLVKSLVDHADVVLFSAAIPGQGGQFHINERWLSYWVKHFEKHDFILHDVVRQKFWEDKSVDIWYRQNMVIFCRSGHALTARLQRIESTCIDIVHPELFTFYVRQAERAQLYERGKLGVKTAAIAFIKALKNKLK